MSEHALSLTVAAPRQNLLSMIGELWSRLSSLRRKQFVGLLVLMVIASVAEVCSVAAVLPFLGVLTAPEKVFAHAYVQPFIAIFAIETPQQLLLPVVVVFCAAALLAGVVRLLLVFVTTRYSFVLGADLSLDVYRRSLYQPYTVHTSRNSSDIINAILNQAWTIVGGIIIPLLTVLSSLLLFAGIFSGMLAVDAKIAVSAAVIFGGLYGAILLATRHRLRKNSEIVATESRRVLKSLQEGLGGIRDVLLDGTQELHCRLYHQADLRGRLAQSANSFIAASPRFVIETLGMILIAVFAYGVSLREGGMVAAIPVLGTLALGAQRLLPILQQAYASVAAMRGSQAALRDILVLLDQPLPLSQPAAAAADILFREELALRGVGFRYAGDGALVLNDVNLRVAKGQRIGVMGVTGSGKSTLLDVVMGLLQPTAGELTVDGKKVDSSNQRSWQKHITHVPQAIYLADGTVEENIAVGVPKDEIDKVRLQSAARQAQLADLIESWPEKYDTPVGERGVKLSGGQRQRIGIARALYKRADVIIFDEATSALDNETEKALMAAIDDLGRDLTILIIAHRLSTLRGCDLVVEIGDGGVKRAGRYEELVSDP